MKPDQRITRLAQILVQYSIEVKEKEKVIIHGSTASECLLREIYQEVLRSGAHPTLHIDFQDQQYLFYKFAKDFQIEYTDPFSLYEMENSDAVIALLPFYSPHELTSIDPEKKQKYYAARKPILEPMYKRSLRWVLSLCPTPALAQEAHMSLDEYSEFVFSCMNLNADNPVDFWKDFSANQEDICDRLNQANEFRYIGLDLGQEKIQSKVQFVLLTREFFWEKK